MGSTVPYWLALLLEFLEHCILCNEVLLQSKDIPLIPYNDQQEAALDDKFFCLLLKYLGFKSGSECGVIFPRIPAHLTAEQLLSRAREMGTITCANPTNKKPESL